MVSLGVPIGNELDEEAFWETKYRSTKRVLAQWKYVLGKTTKGRVLISKLMIYSRFRYWAQCMTMPDKIIKDIESDVSALIWQKDPQFDMQEKGTKKGFKRKMTQEAAYNPWGKGGIGMLHWPSHIKALLAKWAIRYMDPGKGAWKLILDHWIGDNFYCSRGVLLSSIPTEKILGGIPDSFPVLKFWREAVKAFRELYIIPCKISKETTRGSLEGEPPWHNPRFEIKMDTINAITWCDQTHLHVETMGELWDFTKDKWWSSNDIRRFLRAKKITDPRIVLETIQDWRYIRAQFPKEFTEGHGSVTDGHSPL